eukprot:scaffold622_cov335-Pavlova_lutheri.AAC.12
MFPASCLLFPFLGTALGMASVPCLVSCRAFRCATSFFPSGPSFFPFPCACLSSVASRVSPSDPFPPHAPSSLGSRTADRRLCAVRFPSRTVDLRQWWNTFPSFHTPLPLPLPLPPSQSPTPTPTQSPSPTPSHPLSLSIPLPLSIPLSISLCPCLTVCGSHWLSPVGRGRRGGDEPPPPASKDRGGNRGDREVFVWTRRGRETDPDEDLRTGGRGGPTVTGGSFGSPKGVRPGTDPSGVPFHRDSDPERKGSIPRSPTLAPFIETWDTAWSCVQPSLRQPQGGPAGSCSGS